jgi:hypothetical protein
LIIIKNNLLIKNNILMTENAINKCLNKGHLPYVCVGDPNIIHSDDISDDDDSDVLDLQVIGILTGTDGHLKDHDQILCVDSRRHTYALNISWVLAFGCNYCLNTTKTCTTKTCS